MQPAADGARYPPEADPVVVRVGFFLRDVNQIEEAEQRFEFEGILTLQWTDPGRAFDPAEIGVDERVYQGEYEVAELASVWRPQLVLANGSGGYERQATLLRHRFDGRMTYVQELNAFAEIPVELRRFPFDRESLRIVFEPLGFAADEVVLELDPATTGTRPGGVSVSEWRLEAFGGTRGSDEVGDEAVSSAVFTLEVARLPGFLVRVVIIPMMVLVALSWSVFWMDRESLGDRMDISFIGILTVVAYQIMVSSTLPRIPYFTIMSGFIYASFFTICASVIVNLTVGRLDRTGRSELGNRVDRTCRWAFPLAYVTQLVVSTTYILVRY